MSKRCHALFLITPTFPYDDMLIFQQKLVDKPYSPNE
uniref:Uncharacterized protein n=1 Tax=Arundo donax TaxID=35708 RepID=A0A0A9FAC3_ARUDO